MKKNNFFLLCITLLFFLGYSASDAGKSNSNMYLSRVKGYYKVSQIIRIFVDKNFVVLLDEKYNPYFVISNKDTVKGQSEIISGHSYYFSLIRVTDSLMYKSSLPGHSRGPEIVIIHLSNTNYETDEIEIWNNGKFVVPIYTAEELNGLNYIDKDKK